MTPTREHAGVDYRQWRALLRAHALTDYSRLLGHDGGAAAVRARLGLILGLVLGGLMSLGAATVIWRAPDLLLGASVMTALTMLVVGILVISTAVSLIGPDDFAIVGFRPVSSRTYFAARASALLMGAIEVAVPIGWLPVVACFARGGGSIALAAAAALAIAASSCVVTLLIAAVFGVLLRFISPAKLTRWVLSVQTLGFVALFTAYWVPWVVGRAEFASLVSVTLPSTPAILLFPGTWFGSYIALAAGRADSLVWEAAAVSLVALGVAAWGAVGPLSARYIAALGRRASEAAPARPVSMMRFARFRDERRATLIVLTSQVRADLTVQAGLLTGMVMVVIMGGVFFMQDLGSAAFALVFAPMNEWAALQRSSEHEAVWPFFTTPCNRAVAVMTTRDAVAVFVLGPLVLLFLAAHLALASSANAVADVTTAGLASYLTLQLCVLANPALPFSLPMVGRQTRFFASLGATLGGGIVIFLMRFALHSRVGIVMVAVGTVVAAVALNKATAWRIQRIERRRSKDPAYNGGDSDRRRRPGL